MRMIASSAFAAALVCLATCVEAAPCAGFTDVEDSSSFCVNVEWLKNRSVTLGCMASAYCPSDPVTRLQMAAFLNRLAEVLSPVHVFDDGGLGATSPIGTLFVCPTADVPAVPYARQVLHIANVTIQSIGELYYSLTPAYSPNGGTNWFVQGSVTMRSGLPSAGYSSASVVLAYALPANTTARFSVRVQHIDGATDGFSSLRCQVAATLTNANSAAPVLDIIPPASAD